MDTRIKSVTEDLTIVVQSDDPAFNWSDARQATDAYLLREHRGENWVHRDTDVSNYDERVVTFRRIRTKSDRRANGPSWDGLGGQEAESDETN